MAKDDLEFSDWTITDTDDFLKGNPLITDDKYWQEKRDKMDSADKDVK